MERNAVSLRSRIPACMILPILSFALLAPMRLRAEETERPGPLVRRWYNAHELLSALAERDGIRWAMPETLAGNALIGGENLSVRQIMDDACAQFDLAWLRAQDGIVVVHRADDEALQRHAATLKAGGAAAVEAAWELGWLRDGRALPFLAEALIGSDPAVALAAAHAIETLDKRIPLGRTHRVDAVEPGRETLAKAFPPAVSVDGLLDSPYPPLRAAALRLLLGMGGERASAAADRTAGDRSARVRDVRQQMLFEAAGTEAKAEQLPPLPDTPEAIRAECRKMLDEIPELAKQSQWEAMRYRARVMADWSVRGSPEASEAIVELSQTLEQRFWYPAYVGMRMSRSGDARVQDRVRDHFAGADRDTLVRGLERTRYGAGLMEFTQAFLHEQTVGYVTARKAGREALDDLLALAGKAAQGRYASLDALGVVGGSRATQALADALRRDEPGEDTLAFRSAKALGMAGNAVALDALLGATEEGNRARRHAATLFLGRIGGPRATVRLRTMLAQETDRLVQAAAADALEQIGGNEEAVGSFRAADAGVPPLTYRPRNPRFGPDFPVGQWVNQEIQIKAYANYGEIGWNYDAANKLLFRYGGCSGYTCELTLFDPGTETFVQRYPNEEMAGWDSRRPVRGCSGGRTWDPHLKTAWIGPAIGGSVADLAMAEYYIKDGNYQLCSYDLATDLFQSAARAPNCGRYAYDWKHGLLLPIAFTHPNHRTKNWQALDTRHPNPYGPDAWKDLTDQDAPYPFSSTARYTIGEVHQHAGTLVVFVPVHNDPRTREEEQPPQTWTWNPQTNRWKNMEPEVQPRPGVWGAGFVYDPFTRKLILHSGRKTSQYGGPDDAMTWTYDLDTNTWTEIANAGGPGNPWVGAMVFDPEHNVVLVMNFRARNVWAFRHAAIAEGTTVRPGAE